MNLSFLEIDWDTKLGVMTICNQAAKRIKSEYKKRGTRIMALFDNEPHEFKSEADQRNLVKFVTDLVYPLFEKKIGFTGNN